MGTCVYLDYLEDDSDKGKLRSNQSQVPKDPSV